MSGPPGRLWNMTTTHPSDQRLATIRGLLAKAEATEFPHEAEAFTAKASELMARYSIDEALLWAAGSGRGDRDQPTETQLTIHRPFLVQKGYLVSAIANASGCRSVRYMGGKGARSEVVSLVGFGTDLEVLEALITSLFIQLTTAMTTQTPAGLGGSQVSAWRRSFIMGFAETVSERITQSRRAATHDSDRSAAQTTNGVPSGTEVVLRERVDAVEDEMYKRYPRLTQARVSVGSSAAGRSDGKAAGTRADLGGTRLRGSKALTS